MLTGYDDLGIGGDDGRAGSAGPDLRSFARRVTEETGRKLLLSIAVVVVLGLLARGVEALADLALPGDKHVQTRFYWRQGTRLAAAIIGVLALLSI